MPETKTIDTVLQEIEEAGKQIKRVREAIRNRRIAHPEVDDTALETALAYWEEQKKEAENELRRLSR